MKGARPILRAVLWVGNSQFLPHLNAVGAEVVPAPQLTNADTIAGGNGVDRLVAFNRMELGCRSRGRSRGLYGRGYFRGGRIRQADRITRFEPLERIRIQPLDVP